MIFPIAVVLVAFAAGAVASVAGFGIGSLLTPLLALEVGIQLAVVIVAIPHAAGTALRCWRLRRAIDRRVLLGFGITSAAGGLFGALLHARATSPALTIVFGALLILAGIAGLTGFMERVHLSGPGAWIAGALSGFFGGLVGNQGGIRSAALLAFPLSRESFVATATATALLVDAARVPVYLATAGDRLIELRWLVVAATAGVLLGTLFGERILRSISESAFRRVVASLILLLGVAVLAG